MSEKILLLGSTKDLIDPVSKIFKKGGYEVARTFSLKEALKEINIT